MWTSQVVAPGALVPKAFTYMTQLHPVRAFLPVASLTSRGCGEKTMVLSGLPALLSGGLTFLRVIPWVPSAPSRRTSVKRAFS